MMTTEQEIRCRALDLALSAGITYVNNGAGEVTAAQLVGSALDGARHFAEYITYGTTLAAPDLGSERDTH